MNKNNEEDNDEKIKTDNGDLKKTVKAASLYAADELVNSKIKDFGLSEQYVRERYLDQAAMNQYKKSYFGGKRTAVDEYTGRVLHSNRTAAENKYGSNRYTYHTSDTDHIVPLKDVHQKAKDSIAGNLITDDELRDIVNSDDNFAVTSGHTNRSKGAKSNKQFVKNDDGSLSNQNKKAMVDKADAAEKILDRNIKTQAAKNLVKASHEAAVNASKGSAMIGGCLSLTQNVVAVITGEKEIEDAACDVFKDTASSAVAGYEAGFIDSSVKNIMKNSNSSILQSLSKANLPMTAIMIAVDATKTLGSYLNGDISGLECFEQLGKQGTGAVSSALFATVGQIVCPVPVLGSVIGGLVGYAISSASYGLLVSSLKEANLAKERREAIERECAEHIKMIKAYRAEMEKNIGEYFSNYMNLFNDSFNGIKQSLQIGDVDGFISSTNKIVEGLGKKPIFNNQNDFDKLMMSEEIIKI